MAPSQRCPGGLVAGTLQPLLVPARLDVRGRCCDMGTGRRRRRDEILGLRLACSREWNYWGMAWDQVAAVALCGACVALVRTDVQRAGAQWQPGGWTCGMHFPFRGGTTSSRRMRLHIAALVGFGSSGYQLL